LSFRTIKEALSWLFWAKRSELSNYTVVILDRLSPTGTAEISANEIESFDANYIYLKDGTVIPLHRVVGLKKGDSYVWKRWKESSPM
jgi:Uncharacterized protein conserved in archaea